ncbi:MAG TPA: hypothetical protein VJY62_06820, partial [Bacteroidia bacterium]|nr:hypothetical protein [Bacteroidia bacterium]
MKKTNNTMKSKLAQFTMVFVLAFLLLVNSAIVYAKNDTHGRVARKVSELNQKGAFTREYNVFSVAQSSTAEALHATVR